MCVQDKASVAKGVGRKGVISCICMEYLKRAVLERVAGEPITRALPT